MSFSSKCDGGLSTRNAMNGILNTIPTIAFLKVEIKGLYELTILMNIRYNLDE